MLVRGKIMSVNIVKYNEIIDKINECINWFERLDIKNNRINFYLDFVFSQVKINLD